MKKPVIAALCCFLALGTATAAFAEEPTPTPAPELVELSPEDTAPQFYPDSISWQEDGGQMLVIKQYNVPYDTAVADLTESGMQWGGSDYTLWGVTQSVEGGVTEEKEVTQDFELSVRSADAETARPRRSRHSPEASRSGGGHANQQHNTLHVGDEVQFPRLGVDIAGQDVVEHDVLDEVRLIEFFVVILLDALQADGQHSGELLSRGVGALDKDSIVVVLCVGELVIGIAITHKSIPGSLTHGCNALTHFADLPQFRAGNDGAGLINDADNTIHCVFHLVDHILEYPVCHNM